MQAATSGGSRRQSLLQAVGYLCCVAAGLVVVWGIDVAVRGALRPEYMRPLSLQLGGIALCIGLGLFGVGRLVLRRCA